MRLDLAQYREMAAFAQFGSELDSATQAQLARGQRMVEILKQDQYQPLPVEKQIIIIYMGVNGYLDDIPVEKSRDFEERFLQFLDDKYGDIGRDIIESGILSEETEDKMKDSIEEYKEIFKAQ